MSCVGAVNPRRIPGSYERNTTWQQQNQNCLSLIRAYSKISDIAASFHKTKVYLKSLSRLNYSSKTKTINLSASCSSICKCLEIRCYNVVFRPNSKQGDRLLTWGRPLNAVRELQTTPLYQPLTCTQGPWVGGCIIPRAGCDCEDGGKIQNETSNCPSSRAKKTPFLGENDRKSAHTTQL